MCGIVGVMTSRFWGRDHARLAVQRMVTHSRHRGPDGSGTAEVRLAGDAGYLALGHTRLSIIDLSDKAHQPMQDPATGSWLVYNGEVYNFRELRRALQQEGAVFASDGDTEVVLHALLHWREGALTKFQGMFSFAFWDARKQELLMARDRFGIKPLYYFQRSGLLLFASEVKVLQAAEIQEFDTNPEAINSFLAFGAVLGPSTILKDVKELQAGSLLQISSPEGDATSRPYSCLGSEILAQPDRASSFRSASEEVAECLSAAVRSQLVSDVPVGIPLSGGIDSSLLACLAARQHDRVNLLTIGFPEEEFSEVTFAEEIARPLGLAHHVIHLTPADLEGLLSCALRAFDQPTVDGINTFVLSNVAASLGLRVLLSGLGGDELFGGYTTFQRVPLLWRYRFALRHVARLATKFGARSVMWSKLNHASRLRNPSEAYFLQRCIRWQQFRDSEGEEAAAGIFNNEPNSEAAAMGSDSFLAIAWLELSIYMRNQLLRDADVFSMANSVELRVPFLDSQLATTALALPRSHHFDRHGGKRITRRILEQVSGRRSRRRKMGFTFPWSPWLQGPFKATLTETLLEKSLYNSLGLNFRYGHELLASFEQRNGTASWMEVWSLFVLLEWEKRNRCAVAQT